MSVPLDPDDILRNLSRMWTGLGKPVNGTPSEGGVLRACSLTLVVIEAPDEDSPSLGETLAALMPRHPARAVVIHSGDAGAPTAQVTAQCWMPFGQHRQICCEQIEITTGENGLNDIVPILGPIAAPDLPLILWCRGTEALRAPSFGRLAALAARVIVDSSRCSDPKAAIATISGLARSIRLGDLSWTRLTRWREMVAEVFDNPGYAGRITRIARVRVTYGGAEAPAAAYYMAAWLADSLRRAGARAEVALAEEQGAETGRLQAVELSGDGLLVSLRRLRETLITTADGSSRCIDLPAATDRLLMEEELDIVRADPVFERTLAAASLA